MCDHVPFKRVILTPMNGIRLASYLVIALLGIGIAYGLSILASWLSSYLQAPVFLVACVLWMIVGWKYASRFDKDVL